jgi:hypothetical protein
VYGREQLSVDDFCGMSAPNIILLIHLTQCQSNDLMLK